jgi:hypothetical protein
MALRACQGSEAPYLALLIPGAVGAAVGEGISRAPALVESSLDVRTFDVSSAKAIWKAEAHQSCRFRQGASRQVLRPVEPFQVAIRYPLPLLRGAAARLGDLNRTDNSSVMLHEDGASGSRLFQSPMTSFGSCYSSDALHTITPSSLSDS